MEEKSGKEKIIFLLEEAPKRRGRGVIKECGRAFWFCWKILKGNKSGSPKGGGGGGLFRRKGDFSTRGLESRGRMQSAKVG